MGKFKGLRQVQAMCRRAKRVYNPPVFEVKKEMSE